MHYTEGFLGRIFALRLEPGERVPAAVPATTATLPGIAVPEEAARYGRRHRRRRREARDAGLSRDHRGIHAEQPHVDRAEPHHRHDPVHRVRLVAHREGHSRDGAFRHEEEGRRFFF